MILEKFKNFFSAFLAYLLGIIYMLGGPLTFVYLVYSDAQTQHSFVTWIVLLICDVILASLWPLYWLFVFVHWLAS